MLYIYIHFFNDIKWCFFSSHSLAVVFLRFRSIGCESWSWGTGFQGAKKDPAKVWLPRPRDLVTFFFLGRSWAIDLIAPFSFRKRSCRNDPRVQQAVRGKPATLLKQRVRGIWGFEKTTNKPGITTINVIVFFRFYKIWRQKRKDFFILPVIPDVFWKFRGFCCSAPQVGLFPGQEALLNCLKDLGGSPEHHGSSVTFADLFRDLILPIDSVELFWELTRGFQHLTLPWTGCRAFWRSITMTTKRYSVTHRPDGTTGPAARFLQLTEVQLQLTSYSRLAAWTKISRPFHLLTHIGAVKMFEDLTVQACGSGMPGIRAGQSFQAQNNYFAGAGFGFVSFSWLLSAGFWWFFSTFGFLALWMCHFSVSYLCRWSPWKAYAGETALPLKLGSNLFWSKFSVNGAA